MTQRYALVPIMPYTTPLGDKVHRYATMDECHGKVTREQIERMAANYFIRTAGIRQTFWTDLSENQRSIYMRNITAAVESIGLEVEGEGA